MPSYLQSKTKETVSERRLQAEKKGYTCKDFQLGQSDCEHEHWLPSKDNFKSNWYLDWFGWAQKLADNKYTFVGRKGTGKSALVRHIQEEQLAHSGNLSCRLVRDENIKLESILQSDSDAGMFLYEWLILTNIGDMIVHSPMQGESIPEFCKLRKFFEENRGLLEINHRALKALTEKNERGFGLKWFHGDKTTTVEYDNDSDFHYYISNLRQIVLNILRTPLYAEHTFLVMFDDLDWNFNLIDPKQKQRIIELLQITQRYNNDYLRNLDAKILLFIRDDVYRETVTASSTSAKYYASSAFMMEWYDNTLQSTTDESKTLLRRYINMRLRYNFERFKIPYNQNDPWLTFVDEKNFYGRFKKSAFKFLLDLTFYRPRDLMLFFNNIGSYEYHLPMSPENFLSCARRYLEYNMNEIRSELTIVYGDKDMENCMNFLKSVADKICKKNRNGLSYDSIAQQMNYNGLQPRELRRLLAYWLLVACDEDSSKLFFPYREQSNINTLEKSMYKLPRSLFCYFHRESLTNNY